MTRRLVLMTCLWLFSQVVQTWAGGTTGYSRALQVFFLRVWDLIDPHPQVKVIADRYRNQLMQIPGVFAVWPIGDWIAVDVFIHTNEQGDKPRALPRALQALPRTLEGFPLSIHRMYILPPPPGVIVLHPDGKREQTDACPIGFSEEKVFDWRFCVDGSVPIPAMMIPPIREVPFEQAVEIVDRHASALRQLPGVHCLALGEDALYLCADKPVVVPQAIEGIPIRPGLPSGRAWQIF